MGSVNLKRNDLPKIITQLASELDKGVDKTAKDLANYMKPRVWRDTGVVMRTTVDYPAGRLHAVVGVGHHLGKGFYARFHEWGTSRPNKFGIIVAPRPVVGPASEVYRGVFADQLAEAVRKACGGP